jgi:hypothetical protein
MTMTKTMVDCPRHEGAYDCTPFCDVCEGEQVYEYTATRPCEGCGESNMAEFADSNAKDMCVFCTERNDND